MHGNLNDYTAVWAHKREIHFCPIREWLDLWIQSPSFYHRVTTVAFFIPVLSVEGDRCEKWSVQKWWYITIANCAHCSLTACTYYIWTETITSTSQWAYTHTLTYYYMIVLYIYKYATRLYSAFCLEYLLLIPIRNRPTFCQFVVVAVLLFRSFSFFLFHMWYNRIQCDCEMSINSDEHWLLQ